MRRMFLTCLFVVLFISFPVSAQWSTSPDTNNPICTATNSQVYPNIIGDGAGGAIITWEDWRGGGYDSSDIYAQRISASGFVQWITNGVAICTAPYSQYAPRITSDGAGGAIIVWYDYRSGTNWHIYAQKVNASGVVQWTTNGVAICTTPNDQTSPNVVVVGDGAGGAIVAWRDRRSISYDIYAQRVNASGVVQWATNGVAICTEAGNQEDATAISDGSGGAIVTWHDYRVSQSHIYTQKVNSSGLLQWIAGGVPICTAPIGQFSPTITTDGGGGAIITWLDFRSGGNIDIYAQKVSASGVPQWTPDGVAILRTSAYSYPRIVSDSVGGGIITWRGVPSGLEHIYAQRVNASGVLQWTPGGVAICTAASFRSDPAIISDDSGGAIITWHDNRSGSTYDIYAQKVNASGVVQWLTNGAVISRRQGDQQNVTIASDGAGGAIITWQDAYGATSGIYAQRVLASGTLGGTTGVNGNYPFFPTTFALHQNYPNPFNPSTMIQFDIPAAGLVSLRVYNYLGQEVSVLVNENLSPGRYQVSWSAKGFASGVYFYRLQSGSFVETKKLVLLK